MLGPSQDKTRLLFDLSIAQLHGVERNGECTHGSYRLWIGAEDPSG